MKFSIITAVYNSKDTIERCLNSVVSQAGAEIEHIVVDGGSTDGTLDILNRYKDKIAVLVSGKDGGIYFALNKGLSLATGDVVGFLHADDYYPGHYVLAHLSAVFARTNVQAVYGDLSYVRCDGELLRYWKAGEYSLESLRKGWMPPHPAFFARTDLYRRLGDFDTAYRIAADYDLMLRFLYDNRIRAEYLPELLVSMRAGGTSNRNIPNIVRKSIEDYKIMRAHGLPAVFALVYKNFSKLPQFLAGPK